VVSAAAQDGYVCETNDRIHKPPVDSMLEEYIGRDFKEKLNILLFFNEVWRPRKIESARNQRGTNLLSHGHR
jgi:hypothetical protein